VGVECSVQRIVFYMLRRVQLCVVLGSMYMVVCGNCIVNTGQLVQVFWIVCRVEVCVCKVVGME
jgi:hypothetical protein